MRLPRLDGVGSFPLGPVLGGQPSHRFLDGAAGVVRRDVPERGVCHGYWPAAIYSDGKRKSDPAMPRLTIML